ncbi:hypothetical protein B0H14DRAFT_3528051 [Mycena olivaceomarginata]|nr:hypothetical protein B0H14DRAFT_3528051 [Mycena olivaceomarginata]
MHTRTKMDGGTTTPQPTPTPSRCTPTSSLGCKRVPKDMALWGSSLFRRARGVALEGGDEAPRARPHPPASGPAAGDVAAAGKRTKCRAQGRQRADVARRARAGSTVSQGHADTPVETDHERRARCIPPTEFEGFPGSDALAQLQAVDDEDAADLDALAYASLVPRPMGGSQ